MNNLACMQTCLHSDTVSPAAVRELVNRFKDYWWECGTGLPDLGRAYSLQEQLENARQVKNYLRWLAAEFKQHPADANGQRSSQERISRATVQVAKSVWGLGDDDIAALRSYGFIEVAAEFARQARRFDPAISDADIFQASRNVWSMNLMQLLLGLPVELTPAVFAYSLLYPYSDNYLDNPAVPAWVKEAFNTRFYRRLEGESICPANSQEARLSGLINMIEGQFDRRAYPQVYASLQAIHQAQGRSVQLLQGALSPYEADILGICFEKGGTSVLADGYLVAGCLTSQQRDLMFYYGTLTQLVDDLEDVEQDQRDGLMTIYSQTARHWPLDAITNRTLHFAGRVMDAVETVEAPGTGPLKRLVRQSLAPLLIGQAGSVYRFYTRGYLQAIQPHFPLRFSYLRKQRKELARRGVSLIRLVEALSLL